MKAYVYLENGVFLEAKAFGKGGSAFGELVFNTSITGYEEIISDPSYAGQFIVFTMPEIGIVGTNSDDEESGKIHASGIFIREFNNTPSNFRSEQNLEEYFIKNGKFGVYDIDTRYLTKMLRDEGNLRVFVSTEISDKETLKKALQDSARIEEVNYVSIVSTKTPYIHEKGHWDANKGAYSTPKKNGKKIAVMDYGVKRNILNELCDLGLSVEVFPYNTKAKTLIDKFNSGEIHGVFLSNGPGEPKMLKDEIAQIKEIIEARIPIFGICLGHQLLSNAMGYETYKLKFGQHGANHPVQNLFNKSIEITAQNHNYNVPESIAEICDITHRNLFDGTIEGVRYKNYPVFSVQHHPEASAGPNESKYIFKEFLEIL
ncbi:glutamine-hydrolyzing carbamoyl-phosphate synthase small subunit [Campylobacter sp. JMF_01 NE2]|uniref:glutamine-hydrolyzing carbamoyl-phosphate synthase small subunit n=1 Tax=unclassified Campylobacter TaxID=2593542 RepID=UPI0022E99B6A|nr:MULTISPECIES: glutamine-hydrolyzing carbamoyl-phosphate synthase small subunit [unclassified Campylobacter]MDA3045899.1 glutamine-hydrolyzing carbamoyl-phosphate synthase small subunit [Campylobacter sp. VBCF_06 NA8]MDA3052120.1 glutamine-hydrolyzing carbamoyl-phosphate synthase small subunit [Campylobacter sp. JMF_03 NE3]MDA3066454.1 glutamine-hydrolyzing carbamoyl-phosphate synthase small subunit [Campylobacter sp. JMF_01 NE2]MDA3076113.1 glutamine-hydrolyzing carbamoyl-phosphate synthase 